MKRNRRIVEISSREVLKFVLDSDYKIKQSRSYLHLRTKEDGNSSLKLLALDPVFHGTNFPISVIARKVQNISMISHFLNESLSVVRSPREVNMGAELTLALLTVLLTQTVRKNHPF